MLDEFKVDVSNTSVVSPIGYRSTSCGYCKPRTKKSQTDSTDGPDHLETVPTDDPDAKPERENTTGSYYINTPQLSVHDYQDLTEYGWRRSGNVVYLPDSCNSCCIHYTLRLPATDFQPSRQQRQALHRWNRAVLGPEYERAMSLKGLLKRKGNDFDLDFSLNLAQYSNLPARSVVNATPAHRFRVEFEPASFTREKFRVYQTYQLEIHEDEDARQESIFRRFLCESPLFAPVGEGGHCASSIISGTPASTGAGAGTDTNPENGEKLPAYLGTYHLCYYLDDELIGVSVIDLLPRAVSAVYFFYNSTHPFVQRQSLGKVSAMFECAFAQEHSYRYYQMGYLIWSCPKMRYKASIRHQQILDWYTRTWAPLDDAKVQARLDDADGRCARLTDERRKYPPSRMRSLFCPKFPISMFDNNDDEDDVDNRPFPSTITPTEVWHRYRTARATMFDIPACLGIASPEEIVDGIDMSKIALLTSWSRPGAGIDSDSSDAESLSGQSDHDAGDQDDRNTAESGPSRRSDGSPASTISASTTTETTTMKTTKPSTICYTTGFATFLPSVPGFVDVSNFEQIDYVPHLQALHALAVGIDDPTATSVPTILALENPSDIANGRLLGLNEREAQVAGLMLPRTFNSIIGELLALVGPVVARRIERGEVAVALYLSGR